MAGTAAPTWIPFLPSRGTLDHPRYGRVAFTPARNATFVRHFNSGVYQRPVPITAEHQAKLSGALGWIQEVRLTEDGGVAARVEWTPRGRTLVEDGAFKYVSPEWYNEWTAPDTNKTYTDIITGGALTNRPVFKTLCIDQEQRMPTLTYSEAEELIRRAATDPEAYAEYLERRDQIDHALMEPAESMQASEPAYVPGKGFTDAANDQIDQAARRIMASESVGYPKAVELALQRDPGLYDGVAAGYEVKSAAMAQGFPAQESRQFSYSPYRDGANGTRVSTPAGVAAVRRGRDLEDEINTALDDIARQYPLSPRVFQLAKLFDSDKSLRRRAVAACHSS